MGIGQDSKVAAMARVPLFSHCSKKELAHIARIADEIDLSNGRVLTKEGGRAREFFVLLEGTAEVRQKRRKVAVLGPGDFLGEIALVANSVRTATVTATSDVRALVLTDRSFRDLMRHRPEIQSKVLAAVASRLAATL